MGKLEIVVLYDGNCALCLRTKTILQKIDLFKKVTWLSLQEFEEVQKDARFTAKELRSELHILLPNQRVLKGYKAVRRILLISPYTFIFASILYLPFLHFIGDPIYRWIARNRHLFFKQKCDDGSCSL
jgi:predicted DCC family thiol-disulfide oxidoreductase YuxK